ncbi:MAG: alpha/beta hydrolase [Treponema sp.]|nr:alpha/beta hydrolase [Treponema sp.]
MQCIFQDLKTATEIALLFLMAIFFQKLAYRTAIFRFATKSRFQQLPNLTIHSLLKIKEDLKTATKLALLFLMAIFFKTRLFTAVSHFIANWSFKQESKLKPSFLLKNKEQKKLASFFFIALFAQTVFAKSGTPIPLWKNVPEMKNVKSTMYVHFPSSESEKKDLAIIICPGGSYHHLGLYNEGYKSAEWFSKKGVVAFTLKYRTASGGNHYPAMLEDLQRAIQLVRENAERYHISGKHIGIIGYSAGGHLVTMGGAFYKSRNELHKFGIAENTDLRPTFCVPVYPVVSMQDTIAHRWSRKSLLGKEQTPERKDAFSMEMQIPPDMPPTYIVVCKDDPVVLWQNSIELDNALTQAEILHHTEIYEWGGHGFGMLDNKFMKTFHWNETLWHWLLENKIIP